MLNPNERIGALEAAVRRLEGEGPMLVGAMVTAIDVTLERLVGDRTITAELRRGIWDDMGRELCAALIGSDRLVRAARNAIPRSGADAEAVKADHRRVRKALLQVRTPKPEDDT